MTVITLIKDLKISQKILYSFILAFLFIIFIGGIGLYFTAKGADNTSKLHDDNFLPAMLLNKADNNSAKIESELLKLCSVKNNEDKQKIIQEINNNRITAKKLMAEFSALKLDSYEKNKLIEFNKLSDNYINLQSKVIELINEHKNQQAFAYLTANQNSVADLEASIENLVNYNAKQAQQIIKLVKSESVLSINIVAAIVVVAGILAIFIGIWVVTILADPIKASSVVLNEISKGDLTVDKICNDSKDETGILTNAVNSTVKNLRQLIGEVTKLIEEIVLLSEEIAESTNQVSQGSQQVASSVSQLAVGAQNQAESVSISVEGLSKISSVVKQININADNVVKMSVLAEEGANNGYKEAENAILKINEIKNTAVKTSITANKLGILGNEIEQIVELIKNIAEQTNLLALNAAIEAARAGEQGKGFAVVAAEVKKLANQSALSTDKITEIVKEVKSMTDKVVADMDKGVYEINEGVITIENVGNSLKEILKVAQNVNKQAKDVLSVSGNLVKESEQVVELMDGVAAITEETAAQSQEISSISEEQSSNVSQISASIDNLAKIAENLNKHVSVFKI